MKTLLRLLYISLVLTVISCSDDITSLNNNPQAYQSGTVPGENFFSNATRNLVDVVTYGTTPANFSPGMTLKILAQQFAEATYFDASSYNLVNVGNGLWVTLYRDVLLDYKEAKTIIEKELSNPVNTAENLVIIQNKLSIIEILQVYTYSILLNTYGDIPYHGALDTSLKSEALNSDNITPAYDDAALVYEDLFARLDIALSEIDGEESFGEADVIYQGDVAAWIKFGQSLKLRMALTLADVNPTLAKTAAEEAAPFVFESNDDNATLEYLGITPNTNPIWVGLIQSQRFDYVASNTLLEIMEDSSLVDDPRIPFYYTTDKAGGYSAGTYGKGNSYEIFSHPGPGITQQTTPGVLLDYAEIEFYLAEAVVRNYNVGGTAASHYTAGIKASIAYWGGSDSQALAFLADPAINFATAPGSDLSAIARQKYVALFNRGLEAWTEFRRLDYPKFKAPPVANGDFPIRFTYPNSEQTANGDNYTLAAAAIGGDVVSNKVFWDVK